MASGCSCAVKPPPSLPACIFLGAVGLTATPYRPAGEIAHLPYCSRHRLLAGRLRELSSGEA